MKRTTALLLAGVIGLSVQSKAAQNESSPGVRRFAVVVGANNGGKERVRLRYAVSDARTIRRILEELGGVSPEDAVLLVDPDVQTFFSEMSQLRARMEQARTTPRRTELIFYYSGHSDETRLLMNEEAVSYETLREMINQAPADVRIAILDSCASGAFTRLKGGKKKPAFLMDEAYSMKGYAFMTSSSATEASQESDLLGSSFFTHYLASGLRGAADLNEDGRVTLNEAYQFAFSETLAETTQTLNGPQHPNYDIEMSGSGDVVITDIRTGSAVLALSDEIAGRIFVHAPDGQLILEMAKPAGRKASLALDAGEYRVVRLSDGRVFESRIGLKDGREGELSAADFVPAKEKYTTPRGDRAVRLRQEIRSRIFDGRPITTNLSQPTGAVLNQGEILLGIGPVTFTLTDWLQIGTNVFEVLGGVYNVDLKARVAKTEPLAVAAGLKWASFRLKAGESDIDYSNVSPYLALSAKPSDRFTFHLGGRFANISGAVKVEDAEYAPEAEGTMAFAGFDVDISEKTKFLGEFGYDKTFRVYRSGAGFLFGGKTIRFKIGFQYFQQHQSKGFTRLVTGLWWRFGG